MGLAQDYDEDLANAVMETKSHELLFTEAGSISQSESENLRIRGADDVKTSSKAEDETRCPSSSGETRK